MNVSIVVPFGPLRPEQVLPYAGLIQWGPAHRLWQGQSVLVEPHQSFAFVAGSGYRIPVGTSVAIMAFRHPLQAAIDACSLAATLGAPVVAGFGPGANALQRSLLGGSYRSPITATREYLTIMRGLLDGETVQLDGEYFTMHGSLSPALGPTVELGLGVLRSRTARLAGELADVAITWLTPPAYLAEKIVPAVWDGAASARRRAPRLVTMVPVALTVPGRDPVDVVLAGHSGHLSMPHYRATLREAGIPTDPADLTASAAALIDGGVFVTGEPTEIAKDLDAYRQVGVDEVVLNVAGVYTRDGNRQALLELEALLQEIPW